VKPERFSRIRAVFEEVVEEPASLREEALDRLCEDDAELKVEVLSLLVADAGADDFLEPPDGEALDRVFRRTFGEDLVGSSLGAYRVLEVLGSGGMGTVYLAEQDNPRRKVALKVLRSRSASSEQAERFRVEADALARLRHPNIAQVFEAGVEGVSGIGETPWYAMELLEGATDLLNYADKNDLGVNERLVLFAVVCDAVHHGHQRGIIHRDLKPGNVLVDREGVPKIIDFGVARMADAEDGRAGPETEVGQIIGTWQYMSPEQIAGDPENVDTRIDVYALGVLLCELLCGHAPIDIAGRPVVEAALAITNDVARPPSFFAKDVPQELDWIVLRAVEKERERRYSGASELAIDIRRFLAHEPLLAGPPDRIYAARKFVRRHRFGVAAAGVILLSLVGGITSTTLAMLEARRSQDLEHQAKLKAEDEADKARLVTEILTQMWSKALPGQEGGAVRMVDAMDQAVDMIDRELKGQPEIQAMLLSTIGSIYRGLGLDERAQPIVVSALAVFEETDGHYHRNTAACMTLLGNLHENQGNYLEAQRLYEEALEIRIRVLGPDHRATLSSRQNLASILEARESWIASEQVYRENLEARMQTHGEEDPGALIAMRGLAGVLRKQGRVKEADDLLNQEVQISRRILDQRRSVGGDSDPGTLLAMRQLAQVLLRQERFAESAAVQEEEVSIRWGEQYRGAVQTLSAVYAYIEVLDLAERSADAVEWTRKIHEVLSESKGAQHTQTLLALDRLALLLASMGEVVDAEKIFLEGVEIRRQARILAGSRGVVDFVSALHRLGLFYGDEGRHDDSRVVMEEALSVSREELGSETYFAVMSQVYLADQLTLTGAIGRAQAILTELEGSLVQVFRSSQHWRHARNHAALGRCLDLLGDVETAEKILLDGYAALRRAEPMDEGSTQEVLSWLIDHFQRVDKPEQVRRYQLLQD
jgi:non-specific serine/threonine protein kinase/serine/threonine-protein kinase